MKKMQVYDKHKYFCDVWESVNAVLCSRHLSALVNKILMADLDYCEETGKVDPPYPKSSGRA